MKLFKIKIPLHKYGRSYRFDFPISCKKEEGVVGVCAKINTSESCSFFDNEIDSTVANVSISTDSEVIFPSVPVINPVLTSTPLNVIMQPVDYVKLGNKLSIVVEESNDFFGDAEYELKVYVKTKRLC